MLPNILYFKHFNKKNANLVIVLSKLTELNTITLPFEISQILRNKSTVTNLNKKKYTETSISSHKLRIHFDVKILLIERNDISAIRTGSNLYNKFDNMSKKDVSFIFSNYLLNKKNFICSNFIFGFLLRSYSFLKYKKNKTIFNPKSLNVFSINNFKLKNLNKLLNLLKSINFCKDLVSEPANILNPVTYAEKCLPLKKFGLKVKILSLKQLEKISMGSLLSVSRGSAIEPRVIIFEWKVRKSSKPTILVGKGVTFDTGGISIKPARGMEEMIMDMAGSAVVVGSMMNIALNKINKPIVGIIGLVENMPDAKAQRPGDIVRSLSGQTIEVLNTDAEGRLVLADLLTYVQKKYSPKEIIDFATLTGAIMIALGTHKAGLFSNNDKLSRRLENSGKITGENVWRMPLGRTYDKEIDSQRADMKNIGTTIFGGSIQAAQFLKRFIKDDIPWAHLDIAGVTWSVKNTQNGFSELHAQGATAFGVRLIDQFLKSK